MDENEKMAKKKEPTTGEIMAKEIIAKYKPKTVADMQDALKDIFGPMEKWTIIWAMILTIKAQKRPKTDVTVT